MKSRSVECKTKIPETGAEVSCVVTYDFPESLGEAVAKFGEESTFKVYDQQLETNVKNLARAKLREGAKPEDIQLSVSTYIPGQQRERTYDPTKAVLGAWVKMSPEARAELLAQLTASA